MAHFRRFFVRGVPYPTDKRQKRALYGFPAFGVRGLHLPES